MTRLCIFGEAPKMAGEAPALPITSGQRRTDYHAMSLWVFGMTNLRKVFQQSLKAF
jgi:hypothetical protein